MAKEMSNQTHEEIVQWVKKVRFKRRIFGGVDQDDVLRKIGELNSLYEAALLNERARYDALLQQNKGGGGDGN